MRKVLEDGTILLESGGCEFRFQRPRPGIIIVQSSGRDKGQFGNAPFNEMADDLASFAPVELFIDAGQVISAIVPVQDAWTEWLRENRSALKSVSMLVRSNYMHFTAEVAKLFSRTGELLRVYLDPVRFQEAIARAAPGYTLPRNA
jgi:hypothetical protein